MTGPDGWAWSGKGRVRNPYARLGLESFLSAFKGRMELNELKRRKGSPSLTEREFDVTVFFLFVLCS